MVQQEHVADKLKKSYPFVDLVFGTHVLHRLPELLLRVLENGRQVIERPVEDGVIAEGVPVRRNGGAKAFLPIMYGCNNFCTYCIVPYVRGRERSRDPDRIVEEARQLIREGVKDITLLGQNVNSYGKGETHGVDFPDLLRRINALEGDFLIRFMTSHPKDATPRLFAAIADCPKVSRHFHLPFQSGEQSCAEGHESRVHRGAVSGAHPYRTGDGAGYTFTSDVIVGFPGETREDFEQTLDLIRRVEFVSLFTFLYSPRRGTLAASAGSHSGGREKPLVSGNERSAGGDCRKKAANHGGKRSPRFAGRRGKAACWKPVCRKTWWCGSPTLPPRRSTRRGGMSRWKSPARAVGFSAENCRL